MKSIKNNTGGTLYLVPTPIGNLEDITLRAINILKEVDFIISEDTRTTGNLLKHLGISKPSYAYHIHNEHKTVDSLVARIKSGMNAALVSDAGTPGISDPGYLLVSRGIDQGLNIESLPGPTAFIPALINSGFPNDRFIFEGFLPHKKGRQTRLKELARETKTIILYESPHRLLKTLNQLEEFLGENREVSVSRELTKLHEETLIGPIHELIEHFTENKPRGEIVIVLRGQEKKAKNQDNIFNE